MTARWPLLLLVACNGKGDDDAAGDDDDAPECVEDSDCERLIEVCEGGVCVDGDRNDSIDGATPLLLGDDAAKAGVIYPEGDVDFYVYEADAPQWVSIRTATEEDSPLDTVVSVFDPAGDLHATVDDYPVWPYRVTGFDSVLYAYLPQAGSWNIAVEDASTFYGEDPRGGTDYTFDVLIREANGIRDPDSLTDPGSSVTIEDGNTVWVTGVLLEDADDSDFLEVDVQMLGGPLEVWGQPDIPGSTAAPRVLLHAGPDLVADKLGLGEDGYLSWPTATTGTYVIEAADTSSGGPDAWYVLYVRTYETDDSHPFYGTNVYEGEVEPNDLPSEGLVPTPDVETDDNDQSYTAFRVQGGFDLPGDDDWWLAEAQAGDEVSVRCFTDRFGSLAEVSVLVSDGSGDITPAGQGDAVISDDYYIDGAIVGVTGPLQILVSSRGGGSGPGHWYRCAVFVR